MAYSFEIGPIRPPNESQSLLIRVMRNCAWNKCKFCNSYKGKAFEIRPVDQILRDIVTARLMSDKIMDITLKTDHSGGMKKVISMILKDPPNESFRNVAMWLLGGGENVFFQDADSLVLKTADLQRVLQTLKSTFPKIKRVTGYARSKSASSKKRNELADLRAAGLNRLHVGLESGLNIVLENVNKGETAEQHIKGGRQIIDSGISLSEYIILGLAGKELSSSHARATARVLNQIDPEFIRVRTLVVNSHVPLSSQIASGTFTRATDEEIVREERLLLEDLNVHSEYFSDHISNLLPELQGKLPGDKARLLAILDKFQALSPEEKDNFTVGRRVGLYKYMKDIEDQHRYELTEQIKFRLTRGKRLDPKVIFSLMEEFI